MIRLTEVTLRRGGRVLVEGASASIAPGDRLALIGPNGSGKTTILAALAGEIAADGGEIDLGRSRVVRLAQTLPDSQQSAAEFVVASDPRLAHARAKLACAETAGDGRRLAEAHAELADAGGHDADARAHALLHGLGFEGSQIEAPVVRLSGGWRMRLNLAVALFVPGDLLLLDEPTNHLDLDAIVWLERWLARFDGTLIVVSHDRDFLDRVVRGTLSIENGRLIRYVGGYSACEAQRAERRLTVARAARRASDRAAQLQRFIDRFRAQATKARQVQSRIKALERLPVVASIDEADGVDFSFPAVGETPDPILTAESLAIGHPGGPVLASGIRFVIARGDRIGLLGRNGAGKTTLIRTLLGDLSALGGELWRSPNVRVGYFAQAAVERLREDETPLQHLARLLPGRREAELRAMLARYGLRDDDAIRPVGPMSGGERARLVLAIVSAGTPQLLLLDEPTNHLDASARDALTEALARYEGALLLVSHDRYLIRAVVDRLVVVRDGAVRDFEGDVDDYTASLSARQAQSAASMPGEDSRDPAAPGRDPAASGRAPAQREASPGSRRESRRVAAERRASQAALRRPLEARLREVEHAIDAHTAAIRDIDDAIAALPGYFDDPGRVADDARRRASLARDLQQLEDRWLAVQVELENLVRSEEAN